MELTHSEKIQLTDRLLACTYKGPATQWVDRVADLCRQAGFTMKDMAGIAWQNPASNVTLDIAFKSKVRFDRPLYEKLLELIAEKEKES